MRLGFLTFLSLAACGASSPPPTTAEQPSPSAAPVASAPAPAPSLTMGPATVEAAPPTAHANETCGGAPMTVRFFDAGQALSALVELPDGKRILVDAGESPTRPGCGAPCKEWHKRVMTELGAALGGNPLDLLWITHQHSDHIGGGVDVISKFKPKTYVDNGRDLDKATISKVRDEATKDGVNVVVVEPGHATVPLASASSDVKLSAIVPTSWPAACGDNPNDCSIALRIDYCNSSVLFTGDAEAEEEAQLETGPVTLLQVGHHGSSTSTSAPFLAKVKPKYAVISSGKQDEGTNLGYCHPRAETIEHLTTEMGGAGAETVHAFDGKVKCDKQHPAPAHWIDTPAADSIWVTARDGEVTLVTKGDGNFERTSH